MPEQEMHHSGEAVPLLKILCFKENRLLLRLRSRQCGKLIKVAPVIASHVWYMLNLCAISIDNHIQHATNTIQCTEFDVARGQSKWKVAVSCIIPSCQSRHGLLLKAKTQYEITWNHNSLQHPKYHDLPLYTIHQQAPSIGELKNSRISGPVTWASRPASKLWTEQCNMWLKWRWIWKRICY